MATVSKSDDQSQQIDPLLEDALDWVLLLRSGQATTLDAEALQIWRALSPDHDRVFRAAATLLHNLEAMMQSLKLAS
jgi:transmembrane sensor